MEKFLWYAVQFESNNRQAVSGKIKPFLDSIVSAIRLGIAPAKKKEFCPESLTCASMLARFFTSYSHLTLNCRAVGPALRSYMDELLGDMMCIGLHPVLTSSLRVMGEHIPAVMPDIQEFLLNLLSTMLGHRPFSEPGIFHQLENIISRNNYFSHEED